MTDYVQKYAFRTPKDISMASDTEAKKIFITEDEFIVSKNLESKLTSLGYEVTGTAPSGEEAIQQISENPPDIVLMDIMLAGEIDGIETARKIREEHDIPVIFLTAYSSEEIYKRAALAEPYAYIIKPYEERELEINIAIALYKSNIERQYAEKQLELEKLNSNLDKLVEERTKDLIREINERKKAQELQMRFYDIVEQTSDHIMITDIKGVIEYVNPAISEFTGFDKNEMIGNTPGILKSGMYEKEYYNELWSVIQTGNSFSDEFVNRKKDGTLYTVAQIILPLKNLDGEITHFASVSRDFSEKKLFEKKLVDLQEDERSKMSRELHDGIGQSVAAVKLAVHALAEKYRVIDNDVDQITSYFDILTATVREVSYNLMPNVLRDYGLIPAINKLLNTIEENSILEIYFKHGDIPKKISTDIELSLFRILQEALNNTLKYARANKMAIKLYCHEKTIHLEIKDNGVGFDVKKVLKEAGQGLRNMKHRSHLLNGVFKIESNQNGTTIIVKIPYKQNENN